MAPSQLCKLIRIQMRNKLGSSPQHQHQISANLSMFVEGGTKRDHILREKQREVMNCFIKKALVEVWPSQTSSVPGAWLMATVQCRTSLSMLKILLIPNDCILWCGFWKITRTVSLPISQSPFTAKKSLSFSRFIVNTVGIHDITILAETDKNNYVRFYLNLKCIPGMKHSEKEWKDFPLKEELLSSCSYKL